MRRSQDHSAHTEQDIAKNTAGGGGDEIGLSTKTVSKTYLIKFTFDTLLQLDLHLTSPSIQLKSLLVAESTRKSSNFTVVSQSNRPFLST